MLPLNVWFTWDFPNIVILCCLVGFYFHTSWCVWSYICTYTSKSLSRGSLSWTDYVMGGSLSKSAIGSFMICSFSARWIELCFLSNTDLSRIMNPLALKGQYCVYLHRLVVLFLTCLLPIFALLSVYSALWVSGIHCKAELFSGLTCHFDGKQHTVSVFLKAVKTWFPAFTFASDRGI